VRRKHPVVPGKGRRRAACRKAGFLIGENVSGSNGVRFGVKLGSPNNRTDASASGAFADTSACGVNGVNSEVLSSGKLNPRARNGGLFETILTAVQ
jgi:hypothetical protein